MDVAVLLELEACEAQIYPRIATVRLRRSPQNASFVCSDGRSHHGVPTNREARR
jgi:hypothetical protein